MNKHCIKFEIKPHAHESVDLIDLTKGKQLAKCRQQTSIKNKVKNFFKRILNKFNKTRGEF